MEKVTVDVHIESKEKDSLGPRSGVETDVKALNDTELWERLSAYGISPGPILPSTRTTYENKLLQLIKQCPAAISEEESGLDNFEIETNAKQGQITETVLQGNKLKLTSGCGSEIDNNLDADMAERQKKLLSPDVEHSLAKIVEELQEILPEGKVALNRSQGLRKKSGISPDRNNRQKINNAPYIDYGYPDANSVGLSTKRRTVRENTPSVNKSPGVKTSQRSVPSEESLIPTRIKIAVLAIFIVLLFVYVTMEVHGANPFKNIIS